MRVAALPVAVRAAVSVSALACISVRAVEQHRAEPAVYAAGFASLR